MSGIDYEPLENWTHQGFSNRHRRNKPVRLNDREALLALLRRFERFAGTNEFMLAINEEDYDSTVPFDELIDTFPRVVSVFHLQTHTEPSIVVRLVSWRGGETVVDAPQGDVFNSALRSLIGTIENNSKTLGILRHLSRSKWKWLAKRYRLSVLERSSRDAIAERRYAMWAALTGGAFGFASGVISTIVTAAVTG